MTGSYVPVVHVSHMDFGQLKSTQRRRDGMSVVCVDL